METAAFATVPRKVLRRAPSQGPWAHPGPLKETDWSSTAHGCRGER